MRWVLLRGIGQPVVRDDVHREVAAGVIKKLLANVTLIVQALLTDGESEWHSPSGRGVRVADTQSSLLTGDKGG